MDNIVIVEMWEGIKEHIKEKDRAHSMKNMLVVLEEHGHLDEHNFEELVHEDKYFEEAIKSIYKAMGEDYEEEEDEWGDE